MESQVLYFEITIPEESINPEKLKDWLEENYDKWAFQVQKNDQTSLLEYHLGIKMKKKIRPNTLIRKLVPDNWDVNATKIDWDDIINPKNKLKGPWVSWEDKEVELQSWEKTSWN